MNDYSEFFTQSKTLMSNLSIQYKLVILSDPSHTLGRAIYLK